MDRTRLTSPRTPPRTPTSAQFKRPSSDYAKTLTITPARLDADLLATILAGWLRTRTRPATPRPRRYRQVIAVDGKTLRGARRADGSQIHLLSALDTSTGIVLAQVTVNAKSNEIPAFTPLLDAVEQVLGSLQ